MKPHPRIRKFFKWGGLVVSVVLLTVWIGTAYGWFFYSMRDASSLDLVRGQIQVSQPSANFQSGLTSIHWMRASPTGFNWSANFDQTADRWFARIPLWPFVALSLATTAAAWRMDIIARRKSRLGACPACGYDRTGLAPAAPCPECNAKA
jgi:hypothetical protein